MTSSIGLLRARGLLVACALAATIAADGPAAAPVTATFTGAQSEHTWTLQEINPDLPRDWTPYGFLVLEFRASSSQRFELGITTAEKTMARVIGPFAGVWVRAAIPLRFYREPPGSAHDLAATYNQPRGSYWINLGGHGGHGATADVRELAVFMKDPVGEPTLEIRSVTLSVHDPGDAVLDGTPLVDRFGQYTRAEWPGKARTESELAAAWADDDERSRTPMPDRCPFGGFAATSAQGTGFFRVEQVDGRWWFVCPDGHLFYSAGVNGVGVASTTRVEGREELFEALPPDDLLPPSRNGRGPLGGSFHTWNLLRRHGAEWRPPWALAAARRLAAWGFNSIHYWGPRSLEDGAEPRVPYAQMLRGWQTDGSIMGLPDVYADDFARRVDDAAASQLAPRKDDPLMLGYFIGNEPAWPHRESQLVDLILQGADGPMRRRLETHLSSGDTPERRREFVHAAFARYLDIVNAATRRHAPNHLNLGIRFGGDPDEALMAAAAGFDVFSMNIYRYAPPREVLDRAHELTKRPLLIGEFHIGVPERGLSSGLVQAMDGAERGIAYRYYVEQSASHPAMIGTHWFQWLDQPATGRMDGENYAIGLVDVTDLPHATLVEAAKTTHGRLLDVHGGKTPPFDRMPKASEGTAP